MILEQTHYKMHPVARDKRYTVTREFCGHKTARYVARFCGEWIGQSEFYSSAAILCVGHDQVRRGAVIIEAIES